MARAQQIVKTGVAKAVGEMFQDHPFVGHGRDDGMNVGAGTAGGEERRGLAGDFVADVDHHPSRGAGGGKKAGSVGGGGLHPGDLVAASGKVVVLDVDQKQGGVGHVQSSRWRLMLALSVASGIETLSDMTNTVQKMTKLTQIFLLDYPGAQQAALLGLRDMFATCDRLASGARAFAVTIAPEPQRCDVLILPPSLGAGGPPPPDTARAAALARVHGQGAVIASACVGAFVLAETGLLDGRPATTHWALAEQFAARFPKVRLCPERLLVDDGDILTAGGVMAWTDLGLRLIGRLRGPARMRALARHLLLDTGPREQRFYMRFAPCFNHGDAAILQVQHWLARRPGDAAGVAGMAARAGLGGRTFLRRFTAATGLTPLNYLQNLRIARAQEALEATRAPVALIAWEVGYADVPAFSRLFRARVGLSPGEYRRRFAGA